MGGGSPIGWFRGRALFGQLLRHASCVTPRYKKKRPRTTVMFSIGQTNIQQASGGHMVGFWIHPLIIWLLTTSLSKHKKSNSCWSQDSKFIFEDFASQRTTLEM